MSVEEQDFTEEFLKDVEAAKRRFVTEAGKILEGAMKRRAPVDSGNLRRGITTTVDEDGDGVFSDTGPTAEYAEYVEYGTVRMDAQPYAEPGFVASQAQIDRLAERELRR